MQGECSQTCAANFTVTDHQPLNHCDPSRFVALPSCPPRPPWCMLFSRACHLSPFTTRMPDDPYSLVLSTATRSNRFILRATSRPETSAAAHTTANENAKVAL